MTRILLLSRYGQRGPSSRMRHYQFLPALARAGLAVEVAPMLPDAYLAALFDGAPRSLTGIARAYLRRLAAMIRSRHFDLVWVEKECLPWLPWGLERLVLGYRPGWRVPMVVDYDDAWFHLYDHHRSGFIRAVLGDKLDRVMRSATLVTVGNDHLAQHAKNAGASRVEILPTVVDLARYPRPIGGTGPATADRPPVVGWIGSPSTARYLDLVASALGHVRRRSPIEVALIGAPPGALASLSPRIHPWREETEVADIATFSIGIMPLADSPWERGKCGYKLIQYMASGKPVIASPVGVNRVIVNHGVNGFLADSEAEWVEALSRLASNPDLRARFGAAGRAMVEDRYTLDLVAPRLAELLTWAARSGGSKLG